MGTLFVVVGKKKGDNNNLPFFVMELDQRDVWVRMDFVEAKARANEMAFNVRDHSYTVHAIGKARYVAG